MRTSVPGEVYLLLSSYSHKHAARLLKVYSQQPVGIAGCTGATGKAAIQDPECRASKLILLRVLDLELDLKSLKNVCQLCISTYTIVFDNTFSH